jgi:hypothetical protein
LKVSCSVSIIKTRYNVEKIVVFPHWDLMFL